MARSRCNGYLHPDVVKVLEGIATTNHFRSIFPAIEMCAKLLYPTKLDHVIAGKYGTESEKEENK